MRTRRWHELLELVLAGLSLRGGVQKIDGENLKNGFSLAICFLALSRCIVSIVVLLSVPSVSNFATVGFRVRAGFISPY